MAGYTPRYNTWKLSSVLSRLDQLSLTNGADRTRYTRTLWHDMSAECHADNLCSHLYLLQGFEMCEEFKAFLYRWRIDELKHYSFMRKIYALLTGHSPKLVTRKLRDMGPPDYSGQQHFFVDQFTLLVLFAYDELVTTISYGDDREIYRRMGNPAAVEGFDFVIRDEANHFANAMELLKRLHKERLAEVPRIISEILVWEQGKHDYNNGFLLDRREVDSFSPELFTRVSDIMQKQLVA